MDVVVSQATSLLGTHSGSIDTKSGRTSLAASWKREKQFHCRFTLYQVQVYLIPPILPHQGAVRSHHTLMASYLHYIPTIQVKLHPHCSGQPVTCLMHNPLIPQVLD